jgi:hypothetical protein
MFTGLMGQFGYHEINMQMMTAVRKLSVLRGPDSCWNELVLISLQCNIWCHYQWYTS